MTNYDLSGPDKALVTIAVIMAMLMQVLDTTIANVALPHMQTSLGATRETVNWVLTSYIVASAIAIPITGWLAERVGPLGACDPELSCDVAALAMAYLGDRRPADLAATGWWTVHDPDALERADAAFAAAAATTVPWCGTMF